MNVETIQQSFYFPTIYVGLDLKKNGRKLKRVQTKST